tara:strand:- start:10 stop:120 length:111 start_codon:yes stop_codon:yes gene_type:complete
MGKNVGVFDDDDDEEEDDFFSCFCVKMGKNEIKNKY